MLKKWLILLLLIPGVEIARGQGTSNQILLMTGKVIEGRVTSQDSQYVHYTFEKRAGKTKARKLELERVFSVTDENGQERVVYLMDTAIGNYFTENEMRFYIKGEQDAMNSYKAHWVVLVGVPVTGGVGFALSHSILVFAVPFVYLLGTSVPKYTINPGKVSSPELLKQPAYVLGYERTARTKRLFKALASGVLGTAVGFVAGQSLIE